MFSFWPSVLLASIFGLSIVSALVLLVQVVPRAVRIDQLSKAAAGAGSISMLLPASSALVFIAELVLFTAAATWFIARISNGGIPRSPLDSASPIFAHIHSMSMMGAMAVMSYRALSESHSPQHGNTASHHRISEAIGSDATIVTLAISGVVVAVSSILHYRASIPAAPTHRKLGRWTTWGIGALESAGTLVLIAAMTA